MRAYQCQDDLPVDLASGTAFGHPKICWIDPSHLAMRLQPLSLAFADVM